MGCAAQPRSSYIVSGSIVVALSPCEPYSFRKSAPLIEVGSELLISSNKEGESSTRCFRAVVVAGNAAEDNCAESSVAVWARLARAFWSTVLAIKVAQRTVP